MNNFEPEPRKLKINAEGMVVFSCADTKVRLSGNGVDMIIPAEYDAESDCLRCLAPHYQAPQIGNKPC